MSRAPFAAGRREDVEGRDCPECDGSGNDPKEEALLRISREQVRRGEVNPGIEDKKEPLRIPTFIYILCLIAGFPLGYFLGNIIY